MGNAVIFAHNIFSICISGIKKAVFCKLCQKTENNLQQSSCHLIVELFFEPNILKNKVLQVFAQTYEKQKEISYMVMPGDDDNKVKKSPCMEISCYNDQNKNVSP